jgi:hypothetical protein
LVRGPSHATKQGRTPVLDATTARLLLDHIDMTTLIGLRGRALIALIALFVRAVRCGARDAGRAGASKVVYFQWIA